MKTYKVTRESEISNRIVQELNAAVCTATFPTSTGIHKADLYTSVNSCDCLVYHNTCAPVHSIYVKTVLIEF